MSETVKSTPMALLRRIDDLGRVVIPKEIRRSMHITEGDALALIPTEDGLLLRKYEAFESSTPIVQHAIRSLETVGVKARIFNTVNLIAQTGVKKVSYGCMVPWAWHEELKAQNNNVLYFSAKLHEEDAIVFPIAVPDGQFGFLTIAGDSDDRDLAIAGAIATMLRENLRDHL